MGWVSIEERGSPCRAPSPKFCSWAPQLFANGPFLPFTSQMVSSSCAVWGFSDPPQEEPEDADICLYLVLPVLAGRNEA